jgi:hypothetical protein
LIHFGWQTRARTETVQLTGHRQPAPLRFPSREFGPVGKFGCKPLDRWPSLPHQPLATGCKSLVHPGAESIDVVLGKVFKSVRRSRFNDLQQLALMGQSR